MCNKCCSTQEQKSHFLKDTHFVGLVDSICYLARKMDLTLLQIWMLTLSLTLCVAQSQRRYFNRLSDIPTSDGRLECRGQTIPGVVTVTCSAMCHQPELQIWSGVQVRLSGILKKFNVDPVQWCVSTLVFSVVFSLWFSVPCVCRVLCVCLASRCTSALVDH